VGPDLPAAQALKRMQAAGLGRLFVTEEDGRLTGVLALKDLLHQLRMRREAGAEG